MTVLIHAEGAQRRAYIDFLRGVAILLVVGVHFCGFFSSTPSEVKFAFGSGALGVQLFFIASAFALSLAAKARGEKSGNLEPGFFIRRGFRVLPMYFLAALFYYLMFGFASSWYAPKGLSNSDYLASVLMMGNFFPYANAGPVPGGATINVEFQFYLIFLPLVALLFANKIRTFFVVTGTAFFAGGAAISLYFHFLYPGVPSYITNNAIYYSLPLQVPFFVTGLILFLLLEILELPYLFKYFGPSRPIYFYAGIALLVLVQLLPSAIEKLYAALPCLILVFLGSRGLSVKSRLFRGVRFCGEVSYSLYFVHFMLLYTVGAVLATWVNRSAIHWVVFALGGGAMCLIISFLTYKIIEIPGIRFGSKIARSISLRPLA